MLRALAHRDATQVIAQGRGGLYYVDLDEGLVDTIAPDDAQNLMARGYWEGKVPADVQERIDQLGDPEVGKTARPFGPAGSLTRADWDESKHPRAPAGSPDGGQFTSGGEGGGAGHSVDVSKALATVRDKVVFDRKALEKDVKSFDKQIDAIAVKQDWNETEVRLVTADSATGALPHYELISSYLRDGGKDNERMDKAVGALDSKFQDPSAVLDKDMTVYRGWNDSKPFNFKEGDAVNDKAFTMATMSASYAASATTPRIVDPIDRGLFIAGTRRSDGSVNWDSSRRVVFEIQLKAGDRALVPPTKAAAPEALKSGRRVTNREAIVLLPRNSSFRVTGVHAPTRESAGAQVVTLEPIRG
jgi:hypothetical protein